MILTVVTELKDYSRSVTVTHAKIYISKTVTGRNMIISNRKRMLYQLTPIVVRSLKHVAYTSLMTLSNKRNLYAVLLTSQTRRSACRQDFHKCNSLLRQCVHL